MGRVDEKNERGEKEQQQFKLLLSYKFKLYTIKQFIALGSLSIISQFSKFLNDSVVVNLRKRARILLVKGLREFFHQRRNSIKKISRLNVDDAKCD